MWRLLKDKITDKAYSFDATLIPDGGYRIKVVASDAPSHSPGDALTGEKISDRFEVDTTPPVITNFKAVGAAGRLRRLALHQAVSRQLRRRGCLLAHRPRRIFARCRAVAIHRSRRASSPTPGASTTSSASRWMWRQGKIGEHLITVRAYDRYDNVGVAKTVIPAQGQ